MAYWDVFHSATLEAERSLTTDAVRQALASGQLRPDDLVRPAGQSSWTRFSDSPEFGAFLAGPATAEAIIDEPEPPIPAKFATPSIEQEFAIEVEDRGQSEFEIDPDAFAAIDRDELRRAEHQEEDEFEFHSEPEAQAAKPEPEPIFAPKPSAAGEGMPLLLDEETQKPDRDELNDPIEDIDFDEYDPQDEDEAAAEFTLSRNKAETVEELDLAAMVDVAFQLVLFFLVTATTVLYKSLEIPRPNADAPNPGAVQGQSRSLEDLKDDFILVEIDASGGVKIDRENVAASMNALVENLRAARERTNRKSMLLSADFSTPHKNAVMAYDAASEIGLGIAIANPTPPPANTPPATPSPPARPTASGG